MKKLLIIPLLCASQFLNAQLSISTGTTGQCLNPATTVTAWVTSSPTNAATYSWTVISPSCTASFSLLSGTGSSIAVSYPCCGVFTITCSAYTSTSSVITSTTTMITIHCLPSIGVSVSQPSACSGNTVVFNGLGGSSYTWIAANANHPANGVPYFPTVTQSYTVIGSSAQSCTGSAVISVSVINTPTQSPVATPPIICIGNSATLSATGASNYTWTASGSFPGSGNSSVVVTPTAPTTYTLTKANGACVDTKTITVVVNNLPFVFSVSSPTLVCSGSSSTLTAGGGLSYTLHSPGMPPGGMSGWTAVVNPTASSVYTIAASDGTCVNTTTVSVFVNPNPTLSIVSSSTVLCVGQCATLSLGGANNYSWTTMPPSSVSGSLAVVCPTTPTNYSVTGVNSFSCVSSIQQVIIVNPLPPISFTPGPQPPITCGNSATLQVPFSSANTYSWSTGANTSSIIVTPLQTTCYTVAVALLSTGCANTSAVCVTVNPTPLLVAGLSTVCLGSSANLSVTASGNFIWQPGTFTGSLVNVLPQSLTTYSVTGNLTSGCAASGTHSVFPDPSCAIVWPGDANSDGVVNSSDVFEIGLAFNATGAARTNTGNAWSGHFASAWTGTVSTGPNLAYADCNGDGTINLADTIAIFNNFSSTHSFKLSHSQNLPITIVPESTVAGNGWSRAFIQLASKSSPVNGVYGVAFTVEYNTTEIVGAYLIYPPTFINAGGPNVEFRKPDPSGGAVHAVTVRTGGQSVSGSGTIAEFWFHPKVGLPENTQISLSLSGTRMINAAAFETSLSPEGTTLTYQENPVGLRQDHTEAEVQVYPNPTTGILKIETGKQLLKVRVYDLPGRVLIEQESGTTLDLNTLADGTYILVFEGKDFRFAKRIVKK